MGSNDTILSAADEVHHVSWFHRIFLNRWCWFGVVFVLCAIIIPVTVYLLCFNPSDKSLTTCSIDESYRVRCGPENLDEANCQTLGCCFVNDKCYHSYPSPYRYELTKNGSYQTDQKYTPLGNSVIKEIGITKKMVSDNQIDIIVYDWSREKIAELPATTTATTSTNLNCTIHQNATITITHPITDEQLLSTDIGPLIASKGYWEILVSLETQYIFGGLNVQAKEPNVYVYYNNPQNLSNLPIILAYKNGLFYGLFVNNNGPLEIEILASKMLILRSRTQMSIGFHISFIMGDSFSQIMGLFRNGGKDSSAWIQLPYWNLGVHVCRKLNTTSTNVSKILNEAKEFNKNSSEAGLPYESDCLDANLFSFIMNTTSSNNKDIENFIEQAKKLENKRFIMSFSPQLVESSSTIYTDALKSGILYRNPEECDEILTRNYRNRTVAYPDYGHKNAENWFKKSIQNVPAMRFINAIILRDNWPLFESYSANVTTEDFVYLNEELENALTNVLPWNSKTECDKNNTDIHFEMHNKYGFNLAQQFENIFKSSNPKQDTIIFSSSTYYNNLNQPSRIGTFNQNITMSWLNLRNALAQSLLYSTLVDPLLHMTPVCGSEGNLRSSAHEQLCIRWYLIGATLPFFYIEQNTPFEFPSKTYRTKAVQIIKRRYALLPHYYTVMNYNEIGHETKIWPLIRPVYYHFPYDNITYSLNSQYMIGSNLMVVQMLLPDMTELSLYLPMKNSTDTDMYETVWYEFWDGAYYNLGVTDRENNETMDNTGLTIKIFPYVTDWIMYILGGNIIAIQDFQDMIAGNSEQMRLKPLVIMAALECKKNDQFTTESSTNSEICRANGVHIVTDTMIQPQEILQFDANEQYLRISNIKQASRWICKEDGDVKKSSSVIKKVKIYKNKNRFTIDLDKDLCDSDITNDNYYIFYNKKK